MSDENLDADVLKLLTEDIQKHREYIHTLYRNALWIGAGVVAVGIGLVVYTFGERLDARIFEYRIDEALQKRVSAITEINVDLAKEVILTEAKNAKIEAQSEIAAAGLEAVSNARSEVDKYTTERISKEVEEVVTPKLNELTTEGAEKIIERIAFPSGLVAPFDRVDGCPIGWTLYRPAISRFVVGAFPSGVGVGIDDISALTRALGPSSTAHLLGSTGGEERVALASKEMPEHVHGLGLIVLEDVKVLDFGVGGHIDVPWYLDGSTGLKEGFQDKPNSIMATTGGNAPHNNMPPYIALYYCKKD